MFSLKLLVLYCAIQDISKVFPKVEGNGVMVLVPKKDPSSPKGSFNSSDISNYKIIINKALQSMIFQETQKLLEKKKHKGTCKINKKKLRNMHCPKPSGGHSKKDFVKALNGILDVDLCSGIQGKCHPAKGRMIRKEKLSCKTVNAEDKDTDQKVLKHMKNVLDAGIGVSVLKAVKDKVLQMGLDSKSYKPDDVDIVRKFVYEQLYHDIDSSIGTTIKQTLHSIYKAADQAVV